MEYQEDFDMWDFSKKWFDDGGYADFIRISVGVGDKDYTVINDSINLNNIIHENETNVDKDDEENNDTNNIIQDDNTNANKK